jgi:Fur family transcriptional regulator, iron response regulator
MAGRASRRIRSKHRMLSKKALVLCFAGSMLDPMPQTRPFAPIVARLKSVGLRPTRQRMSLARLLFDGADRHVTAESLHEEARSNRVSVSLATVYNTLHQFTSAGLLREVVVEAGRSYFDTNVTEHHHFFIESQSELVDIPAADLRLAELPEPPAGTKVSRVEVIVRLSK